MKEYIMLNKNLILVITNDKGRNDLMEKEYHTFRYLIAGILFIFVIVFYSGCSDQHAKGEEFSMPPMPVEAADVKVQKVSDKFEAVGTIEAIEEITVVSEIDAAVISLPFEEGSFIKRSQVIARLDDEQLAAELLRTEALYEQSLSTYNRIKSIVEQKAGSPQDLDDARAQLKVAEANLAFAKARYTKTRITAPFDGMVGSRKVSTGSFLRTGDVITTLANLNTIRVSFSAPERFLSDLKRGAEVTLSSPVYPGYEVKGKIIAIEPVLDPSTRNVQVVARVENPGQKFRPGMSANVSAVLSERPEAVTIPNEAVFANGNQLFVFVIQPDSTVMQVPVTAGLQLSDVVEIINGLEAGMQVVQAGHQKLFPGAKVLPVNVQQNSSIQ
jgi:membrane fusion protein, multidrug efflux system